MFLTDQGMYQYKRMPMGDHVSMDAYNYMYDKVTKGVADMKRCVDDSLLYSNTLEKAFHQTAEYLILTGENGILKNPKKFQFGGKEAEWSGFLITSDSVKPLAKHTNAMKTFPNLKKMRRFSSRWLAAMQSCQKWQSSDIC